MLLFFYGKNLNIFEADSMEKERMKIEVRRRRSTINGKS